MEAEHLAFRLGAMQVLGSWAVLNLVVGTAWALRAGDLRVRAFMASNAAWNVVNLALALFGGWAAANHELGSWTGVTLLREVDLLLKILLVNVGLDVGYMGAGVVTFLWGRDRESPWRLGIGAALVLQGLFLFIFDVTLSVMTNAQLERLWPAG